LLGGNDASEETQDADIDVRRQEGSALFKDAENQLSKTGFARESGTKRMLSNYAGLNVLLV